MSEDFPTFAEVGEENVRAHKKRTSGLRCHVLGTPMELIDVEDDDTPTGASGGVRG